MLTSLLLAHLLRAQEPAPLRRALIVGVSDYTRAGSDGSGGRFWDNLTGDQDARLVRDTLVRIGRFEPGQVKVISGHATKAEVVAAFNAWLAPVGRAATKDDVLYFHFSGHGYRFERIASGPPKGARTGLVFSDAKAGDPSALLTNTEFERMLRPLEKANLTVTIDACHSGSLSRTRGALKVRGRAQRGVAKEPTLFAGPGALQEPHGDGFTGEISPNYTAFSACRFDQEALDTGNGGLFTVNYVRALQDLAKESRDAKRTPSYRELFDRTYNLMLRDPNCNGFQNPVIEGSADHELFGRGALSAPRYYPTTVANGALRVEAGLLFGLREGQSLDLYETGGSPANRAAKLATVQVKDVEYNRATLAPPPGTKAGDLGGKWAYPGADAVDPGAVGLVFEDSVADRRAELIKLLSDEKIALRAADPTSADARLALNPATKRMQLKDNAGIVRTEFAPEQLPLQVRNLARWRGVSLLESPPDSACPEFEMEVVPIEVERVGRKSYIKALKPATTTFGRGDHFAVRVRSKTKGTFTPYVSILQLTPDRSVAQFWPDPKETQTAGQIAADGEWRWLGVTGGTVDGATPLGSPASRLIGVWYFVLDPSDLKGNSGTVDGLGGQTFRLFATKEFIDYNPLLTRAPQTRGSNTALGALMKAYSEGTRAASDNVPDVFSISTKTVETVKGG